MVIGIFVYILFLSNRVVIKGDLIEEYFSLSVYRYFCARKQKPMSHLGNKTTEAK